MNDTLGKTLAATRVKKGLSIEEVSAVIRISPKFIRLLEEDHYDSLPGEVFIKGVLRSYAGVVGLSGDEVIARYNALGVHIKDRSPALISVPLRPQSRWLAKIGFYSLAILAVAGVIYYYAGPLEDDVEKHLFPVMDGGKLAKKQVKAIAPAEAPKPVAAQDLPPMQGPQLIKDPKPEPREKAIQPKQPSPAAVATAPNVPAPPAAKKAEPATPPAQTKPAETKPDNTTPRTEDKLRHKLTVTASDVSWISVSADNGASKQIFLNVGETAFWTAEKGFKVTIGNVRGTKIYLDGVEIKVKNAVQNVIKEMNIPVGKSEKPSGAEG